MKLGIISDTHDQVENIKKAIALFNKEKVDLVYHCGDFCAPYWIHLFGNLKCNVKAVFGNNDADVFKHLKWKPSNLEFFDKFLVDEVQGKRICVVHGDPETMVDALFESKKFDFILRGHNHIADIKKNGSTVMINPGSMVKKFEGIKTDWTEPSIAVYDFEKDEARIIKL